MNLSLDTSLLRQIVDSVVDGANRNEIIVQLAVAAGAVALAFLVAHGVCGRFKVNERWKFGKGEFERVFYPLLSVVLVWIAKRVLANFQDSDGGPLEVVLSLLLGWTAIRIAVYVLGHVIPEGGFQRGVIRIVTWAAWITVILHVTGLLPEAMSALEAHGIAVGKDKHEITLLDMAKGLAGLFLTVVLALWVSRVVEGRVMSSESMEVTTRLVITKVLRIVALFVAVFVALPLAGIDVTTLSVLTGAVGVGLGFGLQKIVANYISGFIVLFDRSLRIGDVVTIGGKRGEVKAIDSRYTVLRGGDGVETIIPNEKLITDPVDHHTYSDPKVSVVIGLTVPYEADIDRVCTLLGEAAKKQGRVIEEPPAAARVKQLTDHGVELELTVWIQDPAVGEADLRDELLKDILRIFKAEGISFPYPRREIRVLATPETANSALKTMG
jgi:small-conductance mechanosensitive channel